MPFLFDRLLCATGPFGLGVEFKSDERAVGTWTIELGARGDDAAHPARANANLFVCASATSDARATGAFLVIRQWRVNASDKEQLERLYEMLSIAAIERLDSLLGGVANRAGESRLCVIYLMDGRHFDRRNFSLDRLQIRLLEDLEGALSLAEVDLRVMRMDAEPAGRRMRSSLRPGLHRCKRTIRPSARAMDEPALLRRRTTCPSARSSCAKPFRRRTCAGTAGRQIARIEMRRLPGVIPYPSPPVRARRARRRLPE
jgi:hypothetical protein